MRALLRRLDIEDQVVTLDALYTQRKTAQLIAERGGFYLMTVKGNQEEMLDDLASGFDWEAAQVAATEHETVEKGHGRIETRRCRAINLDLVSPEYVAMPHRRQAVRIERIRRVLRTGRISTETAYGVTSLGPERASTSELLSLTAATGRSRTGCTTSATQATTRTTTGSGRNACGAISPAELTLPSRSSDSTDDSTTCRRPTGTSPHDMAT